MLSRRIETFVRHGGPETFDDLALEAFALQFERIEAYRALCAARGATPESVSHWSDVPPVPTLAFKSLPLAVESPVETFRSSGTTAMSRSVHAHPYPDLYRATIDAAFPGPVLPPGGPPVPCLSLIPDRATAPDSSLSFMIDHAMSRWGTPESAWALGRRGVDHRVVRAWLAARQRDDRPVLVLATSLALLEALEGLDRLGLRFRLPAGSVLFETGGTKGRETATSSVELEERLATSLGLGPERVVGEYGMTELTSQLYTAILSGGSGRHYVAPPWVRVRCLDPATLEPLPEGETGMVALFDLANLSSAVHLLTEDLGGVDERGLELRGRARGAELRGCSLAAEELREGSTPASR